MNIVLSQNFVIVWAIIAIIFYLLWQVILYVIIKKGLKIDYKLWEFIADLFFSGGAEPAGPSIIKKPIKSLAFSLLILFLNLLGIAVALLAGYFIAKLTI